MGLRRFGETVEMCGKAEEEMKFTVDSQRLKVRPEKDRDEKGKDPPLQNANPQGWGTRGRKTESKSSTRGKHAPCAVA